MSQYQMLLSLHTSLNMVKCCSFLYACYMLLSKSYVQNEYQNCQKDWLLYTVASEVYHKTMATKNSITCRKSDASKRISICFVVLLSGTLCVLIVFIPTPQDLMKRPSVSQT